MVAPLSLTSMSHDNVPAKNFHTFHNAVHALVLAIFDERSRNIARVLQAFLFVVSKCNSIIIKCV